MQPWLGQIVLFHPDQKRSLDTVCTDVEYVRTSAGVPLSWLTVPPCVTAKSGSSGPLWNVTLIHCIGSILLTGPKEREAAAPPEALRRHTPQGVGLGPEGSGPRCSQGAPAVGNMPGQSLQTEGRGLTAPCTSDHQGRSMTPVKVWGQHIPRLGPAVVCAAQGTERRASSGPSSGAREQGRALR